MRYSRRIVQLTFTTGLIYLLLSQRQTDLLHPLYTWISNLDPLSGMAALIHGQWSLWLLLSLGALAAAVFWKRFFCGWLCPVGALLDLLAAGKRLIHWQDWKPKASLLKYLGILRFIILGATLGLVLIGYALALFMNPLVLWSREIIRIINPAVPWSLIIIAVLGLSSFPRFWCRLLCPTGSLLNLAGRIRRKHRKPGADCSGCQLCAKGCPMMNIPSEVIIGPDCLSCDQCRRICPTQCFSKTPAVIAETPTFIDVDQSRREFLISVAAGLGVLAFGGAARLFSKVIPGFESNAPLILRPPGALNEKAFNTVCNRCGQCVSVCPTKVIVPAGMEAGLLGLGTPRFAPARNYCTLCGACDRICPTGALAPVPKEQMRMGTAFLFQEKCFGWPRGGYCAIECPFHAIEYDSLHRPSINPKNCNGCGACVTECPGMAIQLFPNGEIRRL